MKVLAVLAVATASVSALTAQASERNAPRHAKDREAQEQVRKLEQDFVDALAKGTKAAAAHFRRVLAEEAVITDQRGASLGKAAFLRMADKGDRGPLEIEQRDLKIQVYGETAVVTGLKFVKTPPAEGVRFTHVYVRRDGRWQMVAAHYSTGQRP